MPQTDTATLDDRAAAAQATAATEAEYAAAGGMRPDQPPDADPVETAFHVLEHALRENALADGAAFDRATSFRRHVMDLALRWAKGRPPHGSGPRTKRPTGAPSAGGAP